MQEPIGLHCGGCSRAPHPMWGRGSAECPQISRSTLFLHIFTTYILGGSLQNWEPWEPYEHHENHTYIKLLQKWEPYIHIYHITLLQKWEPVLLILKIHFVSMSTFSEFDEKQESRFIWKNCKSSKCYQMLFARIPF